MFSGSGAVLETRALLERFPIRRICPQHGSVIDLTEIPLEELLPRTEHAEMPTPMEDISIGEQIDTLRQHNLELQQSIILANDARITDSTTGFYNETFLREFLPTLLGQEHQAVVAVVMLDQKQYHAGTDRLEPQAMAALATELVNAAIPGALHFRFRGPSCVTVVPSGSVEDTRTALVAFINTIRDSQLFPYPTTVSIALACVDRLLPVDTSPEGTSPGRSPSPVDALVPLLDRLRREEPESVLEIGAAGRSIEPASSRYALIASGDFFLVQSLEAVMKAHGIKTVVARNGTAALALADDFPAVVIADRNLPQLDAYQVRQEYLASPVMRDVPFLLILDYKSPDTVQRSLGLEIEHTFVKPVDPMEIAGVCSIILKRSTP